MRATDGEYYPGLDHLRALAAFLVFGWHFTHGFTGTPAPFGPGVTPFLAPFNEGHCGVALFMCLSGYLFARLLDGKQVIWRRFYWNRLLRLAPLLVLIFAYQSVILAINQPDRLLRFARHVIGGFIEPLWDFGAWSIAVEMHFYLLLWIIMPLKQRWRPAMFALVGIGLVTRTLIYRGGGDMEFYAYWTLIGRIDQFALGIAAWEYRGWLKGRHVPMAVATVAFFAFYQWFVTIGGFYGTQGSNPVWIFMPTIEGAFFGFLVVYYDTTFVFTRRWYWRLVEIAGTVSYSVYLLHTFVVFQVAQVADRYLPAMATWEVSEIAALLGFILFVPVAWLSYRFVETPFLRFRTRYTLGHAHGGTGAGVALVPAPAIDPS